MSVTIPARARDLSQRMPAIPKNRAEGIEKMISSPPRTAKGLPQPGRSNIVKTSVSPAIIKNVAASFP